MKENGVRDRDILYIHMLKKLSLEMIVNLNDFP